MITSKYYTGLVVIIFCFAFFIMVSGSAAATANVNTTHMVINQSSNHTTTELNTIKSNIKINRKN